MIQNIIKPFIKYSENNYYLWYFLSDVCACYRRSFLLKNPFPKVGTGEDIIIGKYIIDQKMTKIYDSGIKIRHSHSYNLKQYFQRELGEHQLVTNNLKLKKDINIWYKIRKTFALKETFLTKLTILLQLPIYYLIKFFVFIKNKYGYKKIIDLCFLITTALFLLPSLNLRFIYSQGIGKLFLLLIFAYYGYKLISKKIKPKKNLFISLFIVFFISQVISVVNVVDLSLYIERFKSNIYIYLYFFVAIYILDDEVLSLKTIWLIIGCSVLNIFIKLLLFIDPINTISLLEKILYPGNSQLISMNINRGRIYFDSYDEIIFPLLAFFAYYNKKIRISLIFIGLTLVFISFVTNFRTNLIMILIGIFGSILIYTKKKNIIKNFVNKTIIVLLISAVMFLAYFIGSKIIGFSYVDRLVMSDKDEDVITVDQRIVNWSQAVEIGLSKPLFGTGLGNYNLYLPTQSKKSLFNLPSQEKIINEGLLHPHNLLVFTLAESGFFGLLSLLSLLIYFVFYDYQIFKKTPKLSKSLVVSFWVLFIFSLFNPTLYITYNILFWLLRILIYYENTNRWSHVRPS